MALAGRAKMTAGIVLVASATTATGYYVYTHQKRNQTEDDEHTHSTRSGGHYLGKGVSFL